MPQVAQFCYCQRPVIPWLSGNPQLASYLAMGPATADSFLWKINFSASLRSLVSGLVRDLEGTQLWTNP